MSEPERLLVNEVFCSLQGEGTRSGLRCVFVRLAGCNQRCTWCDTAYALQEGTWVTVGDVLARVRAHRCPLVEVTGGEPLLQPAVYPLMSRLADEFETVMVETSGALSIERIDPRVVRIVDIKCPGSGESERNHWPNIALLRPQDELKFVLLDRADYDWAREVLTHHEPTARCPVLFSPVYGELEPRELAEWILADRLDVRIGLQLHKQIWSPRMRGV